jgi:hypothetical protein
MTSGNVLVGVSSDSETLLKLTVRIVGPFFLWLAYFGVRELNDPKCTSGWFAALLWQIVKGGQLACV